MGKYDVTIDEALMDIMPSFIELTEKDIIELSKALESKNWELAKRLSHTLKGDSGGYGFTEMSEIAKSLEKSIEAEDDQARLGNWNELQEYWSAVKQAFKEEG